MPLSWNEIKSRATAFVKEWEGEASESAEAKSFWDNFFEVFGVHRRRIASFEVPIKRPDGSDGFIDLLWKGILLVEHKSRGKDLDRAYGQAKDYFPGIKDRDLPRYVLVSDFARFRLYDLEDNTQHEFTLTALPRNLRLFGFIAGYQSKAFKDQDPVNIRAAERMGRLHDALKDSGYTGHKLEVLLVRLLFCLFAEDTGIFEPRRRFQDFIERTNEDGSDLGGHLATLFDALDTPVVARQCTLDAQIAGFPYVNGRLFAERLPPPAFNNTMRDRLLDAAGLDWSEISPAIFGALFQSIMDEKARRNLGAHYTSEKNILKLIGPLFLDSLKVELEKAKGGRRKLHELHEKLASLRFLDPACGCGNFLVIAYRELRLVELELIEVLYQKDQEVGQFTDPRLLVKCNVDQFYGIEIEEFPAQIAQLALWLVDHQINMRVSERFGNPFDRLPLVASATIVNDDALLVDWEEVVPKSDLNYILGNPPFSGAMVMSDAARKSFSNAVPDLHGSGVLDYVAAWYWLAAKYIQGTDITVGFVSTNSICQGEQVGLLWRPLFDQFGIRINFAHRTFKWENEARGKAAVHCVIVGYAAKDLGKKVIFDYDAIGGESHSAPAKNINAYLLDSVDVFLENRSTPICDVPRMRFGSMPRDGGNLLLSDEEKKSLLAEEPQSDTFIQPFVGAHGFLNGEARWCIWFHKRDPAALRHLPILRKRVENVKAFRLASKALSTQKFAATPYLFCQISQPDTDYILVPRHSSENRQLIPMGFLSARDIAADSCNSIPGAGKYHFGVLQSSMHMAWVRFTCGRLKSDFRYSKDVVYNNFPWPDIDESRHREAIEELAGKVLNVRGDFPNSTLADLYDPIAMPAELVRAHNALDRAVDAAYGKRAFNSDADRVAFLFERYKRLSSSL
ncbi:hypothetical protein DFR29_1261 [Tahibacter aquaticus]|uniref:site-specific DNA-methyltransferase (adenine-specific) n=1 Tax=Tahibacter aquaticus TaxID=520092 RepID=A0A4R6YJI4_9GAMM|nr:DNA methyltransferase [Tahibacter aquaticus]TDR36966.1 hypothetical protein DFR29_1261 [Tahibacter aquaticus]